MISFIPYSDVSQRTYSLRARLCYLKFHFGFHLPTAGGLAMSCCWWLTTILDCESSDDEVDLVPSVRGCPTNPFKSLEVVVELLTCCCWTLLLANGARPFLRLAPINVRNRGG